MALTSLDTSYEWNHAVFIFLWLGYFTLYSVHVVTCDTVSFFSRLITFYCMDGPHFLYPFACWWAFEFLLAVVNNATMNAGVPITLRDPALNYFGYICRSVLFYHMVVIFLILWGNLMLSNFKGCTIVHSHQQLENSHYQELKIDICSSIIQLLMIFHGILY